MTLGGLALAVGILVDDSTVTIENTHRLPDRGTDVRCPGVLHGAANIAVPTLVSTLAICCVFTSVVFLTGPAKYLFTPLAIAVVFAMLASYALSRTLTPILIGYLLKGEHHGEADVPRGLFARFNAAFDRRSQGYDPAGAAGADVLSHKLNNTIGLNRLLRMGCTAGPKEMAPQALVCLFAAVR